MVSSKHIDSSCFNVGPTSKTAGQYQNNIESMPRVCWVKLPPSKIGDRGFEIHFGLQVSKKQNVSSTISRTFNIVGNLRDRELACSASDRKGSIFESCIIIIHFTILRRFSWPSSAYMICAQRWPKTPCYRILRQKASYPAPHHTTSECCPNPKSD